MLPGPAGKRLFWGESSLCSHCLYIPNEVKSPCPTGRTPEPVCLFDASIFGFGFVQRELPVSCSPAEEITERPLLNVSEV